jgi:hypothetical protein
MTVPVQNLRINGPLTALPVDDGNCHLHFIRILRIFALFLTVPSVSGRSFAQDSSLQVAQPATSLSQTAQDILDDWKNEQEFRTYLQTKFVREHSDQSGRVRPDLWVKGVVEMKRMRTVSQIGPAPMEPPAEK